MPPTSNEPFCEILVLISCVSSIGSNQPAHLCSLARSFTACTQCTYCMCTYMYPFLTCIRNYPVGLSSKFWCKKVVCACIEGAFENAWMVKLVWVFTGYTSVPNLPIRIKYLLHEWPKKAHVILTSCAVSPEHLTARRLIALNAHVSTHYLTLCMLGNLSCFGVCWLFFKINFFFWSVLIWVQTACIGYQQTTYVAANNGRVKRTCTTIHWG